MDTPAVEAPTILGTPFAGGFYAGRFLIGAALYALVVSPKAEGDREKSEWGPTRPPLEVSDRNFYDGLANTRAMAGAGSELAKWAQGLRIGGFDDWYLPSRDELELCYRAFKPTDEENYCYRGDNPSSVPVGYAYSLNAPAQTSGEAFKEGGAEAFEDTWYWSSTQCAGIEGFAWCQDFSDGIQDYGLKGDVLRARAVRRLAI